MKIIVEFWRSELEGIIRAEIEKRFGLDDFPSPNFEFSNDYSWNQLPTALRVTITNAGSEQDAPA